MAAASSSTTTIRRMRRALGVCFMTSCLLMGSSASASLEEHLLQQRHEQLPDKAPLPRNRRQRGLQQTLDYDTLDVSTLEDLWIAEALRAQEEAERLLQGDGMSMRFPTPPPALATLPPALPSVPTVPVPPVSTSAPGTPTVATAVPTPIGGCNGVSRRDFLLNKLSSITPAATLENPASPQGQALIFLDVGDPLTADICTYATTEIRYALLTLYFSTNGPQWVNNTGWLSGASECEWHGITCNDGVFTSNITLSQNNLEGTLPNEISAISTLTRLELFNNELISTIPTGIGNLTQLEVLDLEQNQFNGTLITPELLQLTGLVNLFLSNNEFSGTIPAEINQLSLLESFWAAGNNLIGTVPDTLGDLTTISTLIMYNNLLDNSLDTAPFTRLTNLQNLQLWGNNFQGSIPSTIAGLTQLSVLRLDFNFISGSLPSDIGTMTSLADLRVSNNLLSGSIPTTLASLSQLQFLILGTNFLTGPIPDVFGSNTPNLMALDLSFAGFTGTIPASIFDSTVIEMVYLNNNALTGTVPANFGTASSLRELLLNNNLLTGTVPSIGPSQLPQLAGLTLHFNSLIGSMPESICNLRDTAAGNLTQLFADCQGEAPEIECDFPDCCTQCFDNTMNPAGTTRRNRQRRRGLIEAILSETGVSQSWL